MLYFIKTFSIFVLAGLCEIGGGYLVWQWMKEDKPIWYVIFGCFMLAAYGVVATLQPASFARVYVTYGGIFIFMSLVWAMQFDKFVPDKYDIIGTLVTLLGVGIIYYAPRN